MPSLHEIHSLADFGMCVILWMVQLVIYPSFLRIEPNQLIAWHRAYTVRATFLIGSLMVVQLGLASYTAITQRTILAFTVLVLVLICWALSFLVSVPLHNQINQGDLSLETLRRLIQTNWPRTILWTAIFAIGVL